jgi:hypothetical protein
MVDKHAVAGRVNALRSRGKTRRTNPIAPGRRPSGGSAALTILHHPFRPAAGHESQCVLQTPGQAYRVITGFENGEDFFASQLVL